ncbi:MAG: histidine phosphatase family protein [Dehalococcoidia bacterium]|nr:histidine phosphatase family protein [Dehalococcoidia bacterium]
MSDHFSKKGINIFKLVLIRHGQTEWNREERFRGRFDIELNETGRRQADVTGRALRNLGITAVYTSPLLRSLHTASIIGGFTGHEPVSLEDFIDMDFGQWQGLTPGEAKTRDEALYNVWARTPHLAEFPGGESLSQLHERAVSGLSRIREKHPDNTVALISHKVVCVVLICHVMGLDLSHFWQIEKDNCAVSTFEIRRNMLMIGKINDTCHLKSLDGSA